MSLVSKVELTRKVDVALAGVQVYNNPHTGSLTCNNKLSVKKRNWRSGNRRVGFHNGDILMQEAFEVILRIEGLDT